MNQSYMGVRAGLESEKLQELVSSAYGYLKKAGKFVKQKGVHIASAGLLIYSLNAMPATAADNTENLAQNTAISRTVGASEWEDEWGPGKLIGSFYSEGTYFKQDDIEENPIFANLDIGYNILERDVKDGVLLFPQVRIHGKTNKEDLYWDRYVDGTVGAGYLNPPFWIGADVGYREYFEDEGDDDTFFRVWGSFWDNWQGKAWNDSSSFPLRPELIQYGEVEYTTLDQNVVGTARVEGNLESYSNRSFSIGPFVAAKVNYDSEDEPWYRYGQVSGGLKAQLGRFVGYAEWGHKESFNEDVGEGDYFSATLALFLPIEIR